MMQPFAIEARRLLIPPGVSLSGFIDEGLKGRMEGSGVLNGTTQSERSRTCFLSFRGVGEP